MREKLVFYSGEAQALRPAWEADTSLQCERLTEGLGQIRDPRPNIPCHGSTAEVTLTENIFKTGFTHTTKANMKDNFAQRPMESLSAIPSGLFAKVITRWDLNEIAC